MQPEPDRIDHVAVIGVGTIGASWTALLLAHGLEVTVYDPRPDCAERLRHFVRQAWPALERLGLAEGADPRRVRFAVEPGEAVADAAFVQENGPEDLTTKRALLAALEPGLAPTAIVASSTSGLLPSLLQAGRIGPERYLVGHPFNPPHLIPLVEVVGGQATDPAVVDWVMAFYARLGKKAIRLRRELPGHVANRMQAALYREAIHLVLEGVASPTDIDAAIAYGPGLRWALMGPHALHALAGGEGGLRHLLSHIGPAIDGWWQTLGTPELNATTCERLAAAFDAAEPRPLATLAAERDALLLALLEALARTRAELGAGD
jgi:3-hydroxyacyl-CoA dehydrogenase